MKITEERKAQLLKIKNNLDSLSASIQKIIDGETSMTEFAKEFNIGYTYLSYAIDKDIPFIIRRLGVLSTSDIRQLILDSKSPAENLIQNVLYTENIILGVEDEERVLELVRTKLPEKESKIIIYHFGLEDGCSKSLSETAKKFNLNSSEMVRYYRDNALRRLRQPNNLYLLLPEYDLNFISLNEHPNMKNASSIINIKLEDTCLSNMVINKLKRFGFITVGDVAKLTLKELQNIRNIGRRSYREIIEMLAKYGIVLD